MKFGQWVAVTGVGLAVAYLVASEAAGHKTPVWPYWLALAITMAGGLVMASVLVRSKLLARPLPAVQPPQAEAVPVVEAAKPEPEPEQDPKHENVTAVPPRRPSASLTLRAVQAQNETPAFTARWRAATGHEGSAAGRSTERIFDHPAYRTGATEPPTFLISAIIPCRPLGDGQPGPDGMRGKFSLLIACPAFMDLIAEACEIGPGCGWRPMAGRGRIRLESHLCASTRDPDQFPVASVKLILPDRDIPIAGSDRDRADLLVRINLPSHKVSLPQWRQRFSRALALPGHLAAFVTEELKVPTVGHPAEACLRIVAGQESPSGLTEIVDISMFETLSAPHMPPEFREYQVADPDGKEITTTANTVTQNLAEALHATGYEEALARPSD